MALILKIESSPPNAERRVHSDTNVSMSDIGVKIRIGEIGRANPLSAEDQSITPLRRTDIDSEIRSMSDVDWNRLRRTAQRYAANRRIGVDDLLQEAFCRALQGSRKCPSNVDIVRFLCEAIRSIANGEQDKDNRIPIHLPLDIENEGEHIERPIPGRTNTPEENVRSEQEVSRIQDEMIALLDDDESKLVLLGIMDELSGEELCEFVGIDAKALATKRRYIKRRITAEYPNGWAL